MGAARPDTTIIALHGKTPIIHDSSFIAPGCRIIGDVEIGPDASIWYNCVIRGDVNRIVLGARTNVQDGTVIHCDSPKEGRPEGFATLIGDDVLIGHMAMIHGCVLEDRAFVGMGAIVMDGSRICSDAMLAAGAMLTPGKEMPPRQLWSGRPAKFMRDLNDKAVEQMQRGVTGYVANARYHSAAVATACGKSGDGAAEG